MKKFAKIAAIVFCVIALLIVSAALIIPRVLNPNQHKDRIIALVKEKTGRELKLPGDISVSVFPWVGAKIGEAELGNAPGFEASSFAAIQELRVRVKLVPLLSRQVRVDVVSIKGLALNLARDKNGVTNWDDLLKSDPKKDVEQTEVIPSTSLELPDLIVGGVDIENSAVTWTDHLSGSTMALQDFHMQTSEVNLKDPVTINMGFNLDTADMGVTAKIDTRATIAFGADSGKLVISDLSFNVPELQTKGMGAKLTASRVAEVRFDTKTQIFDLTDLALSGTLFGDSVPGGSMPVRLSLNAHGDVNKQSYVVKPMDVDAAGIKTTVDLTLVQGPNAPEIKGNLAVARFNPRAVFSKLGMALPKTADSGVFSTVEATAGFSVGSDTAEIDGLALGMDDSRLTGGVKIHGFSAPEVSFDLALDKISPERYMPPVENSRPSRKLSNVKMKGTLSADTGFEVVKLRHAALSAKWDDKTPVHVSAADTRLNRKEDTLSIEKLNLKVHEMTLQAKASATDLSTKPAFTADISSGPFNLRQTLNQFDLLPETADAKALSNFSITAAITGTGDAVAVSSFTGTLDETRISGKADIKLTPSPAYAFDVQVNNIDVDRYLPPVQSSSPQPKKTATAKGTTVAPMTIPVETLKKLDLDGKIRMGKLKISNLRLTDIALTVVAKGGRVNLHPISAGLYGGTYAGNMRMDVRGTVPRLDLDEKLVKVRAGDFLNDLQGKALVTGIVDADMKVGGTGPDTQAIVNTLEGTVAFRFADGSVKGMDIVGRICRTLSTFSVSSLKKEDIIGSALQMLTQKVTGAKEPAEADQTAFSEMGGSMRFAQGVGTSDDLMLKSPLLRIEGAGTLDLTRSYLDYRATAALVKSCQGQGGKSFSEVANVPIPVVIKGPLDNLDVKPDITAGIAEILRRSQEKRQKEAEADPAAADTKAGAATSAPPESSETQPAPVKTEEPAKPVEEAVKGLLQDLLKKR